jgi:hypothetical protein
VTVGLSAANFANAVLNIFRGGGVGSAPTPPAALYAKLHVGDPGAAGANNAAAGSATRNALTQGAASGGAQSNSTAPGAWTNGGTSETLTHISVWDASSAGNFLYSVALTASQAWASGNTFTLTSLGITLTPIAA